MFSSYFQLEEIELEEKGQNGWEKFEQIVETINESEGETVVPDIMV